MIRYALGAAGLFAAPVAIYLTVTAESEPEHGLEQGQFVIPHFSTTAYEGREHFAAHCGKCHGAYGEGTDLGPMLVHSLYAPKSFPDDRIVAAATEGATARHWPFGDMPAIETVSELQLAQITSFLREVQEANGIK